MGSEVIATGCLLWAAAGSPSRVRSAVQGYCSLITLSPDEVDRIDKAMWTRPLILACWSFATGRATIAGYGQLVARELAKIRRAATHVRSAIRTGTRPASG